MRKLATQMRTSARKLRLWGAGGEQLLEMKNSINQIKNIVENFTNRLNEAKDRIPAIKDKTEEILTGINKEKNKRDQEAKLKNP